MPYWTRATVGERLAQLVEDCRAIGEQAIDYDNAIGGSVGLPPGQVGDWHAFGETIGAESSRLPTLADALSASAARLPRSDDSDQAEAQGLALAVYLLLHRVLPDLYPHLEATGSTGAAARELWALIVGGEDEALRVSTGLGDLRRSERRRSRSG